MMKKLVRLDTILGATLALVAAAGCQGVFGGDDPENDPARAAAGGAGGPGGTNGAAAAAVPPGIYLRRLTNREYTRTVADVFGETGDLGTDLPPASSLDGYDNNVLALGTSTPVVESFAALATRIAHATVTDATRRAKTLGCEPTGGTRASCLQAIVDRVGRRAYRRPLDADERAGLLALADAAAQDPNPLMSAELVLQGLLQSPSFLYRVEVGEPIAERPGKGRLTGYELATRLSYFLVGTTPDDALLDAAASGALDTADGVAATARRLLTDPRAKDALRVFHTQWLRVNKLATIQRSPAAFPLFTDALRSALAEETTRFVDDFVWTDGAQFLDLLTARYTYVNQASAPLYGVPAPAGAGLTRVDFANDDPHGGILTHGSVLNVTAPSKTLMGILRGKFVRDAFTCETMPPPPAGVTPDPNVDRLTAPACAGCHSFMDPIAKGFARFDMIGAYHPTDAAGASVPTGGRMVGLEQPDFADPRELATRLRASPKVSACVVRQVLRFAGGRSLAPSDDGWVASLDTSFRNSRLDFRELLVALVTSDAYRTYSIEGTQR